MIRVGIAGCGIRGLLFEQSLRRFGDVAVVGMCDPSGVARTGMGSEYSGPIYSDVHELLKLQLDGLIIATPDFAHKEVAIAGANAGVSLLIEKPLATSVADAREIQSAVLGRGVNCLIGFENRWNPKFIRLNDLIKSGALGRILSISGTLSNTFEVPTKMIGWAELSSPAWFLLPHLLDLAMWFTGGNPVEVVARGGRGQLQKRGIDTWDTVHSLFRFNDGVTADFKNQWVLPSASPALVDFEFEVVGSKGSVVVNHMNDGIAMVGSSGLKSVQALPAEINGELLGMASWMVRDWAASLESGKALSPGVEHGATITKFIEEVHRSIERSIR